MGDGVLIYFGYPQAHEDDAERAVRAGLAVIEAVGRLPAREDLRVRLGVATGLAVVGDLIGEGAAQERGVVGETPNLAARLQGLAAPNTLIIGEATRRQVGGLFDLADLGPQALAGFSDPQPAWRVIGESGMLSRFEALRSGETPLGPSTCHAATGASNPFTWAVPRSRYSNRSPSSRRVASAMITPFAGAIACSRAARFGVSPTTPRS